MKKTVLFLIISIVPFFSSAQTVVPPGFVSGTWTLAGSPYLVSGFVFRFSKSSIEQVVFAG